MAKSVYIHIPFCKSKCFYCSFVSYNKLELKKDYLKSLEKEIREIYNGECLKTLYFGGGTPSNLSCSEFEKVINNFNINSETEITAELNPEMLDYSYLRGLFDVGINRLSIGCQSFDDNILKAINRRHNAHQAKNALLTAHNAGFKNVSADFIYGLPLQTCESFIKDLSVALDCGCEHISLYGLTIEEGSKFFESPPNLPDDDMQAQMYLEACDFLSGNNYEHYEISNFSKHGFNSRHNCTYWENEEYYGFGVAAHGYLNSIRYGNEVSLEKYIENPLIHSCENFISENKKLEEEIFLGFRLMKGIDVSSINEKFGIDFNEKYEDVIEIHLQNNLIKKTDRGYCFTTRGALLSNYVLADFIEI